MHFFIAVTGQDDNLGDSLLRRGYLRALRAIPGARLRVFVGSNSTNYISGLGLSADDLVFRDRAKWERSLLESLSRRGQTVLALNPGEARVEPRHEYVGRRTALLGKLVQSRGGYVVQTGLGVRLAHESHPSARLSRFLDRADVVSWRDPVSAAAMERGECGPDWAFNLPADSRHDAERSVLAISMRGDRPFPDDLWFDVVGRLCREGELEPRVVIQVQRDSARGVEIAQRLGVSSSLMHWEDGHHQSRLEALSATYSASRIVLSDRLHALILGALMGAAPVGIATVSVEKIRRTLEPAELHEWCRMPSEAADIAYEDLPSAQTVLSRVAAARSQLEMTTSTIARLVAPSMAQ